MRESVERESATSKGAQGDGVDRSISPLPPEFVAMIGEASPEVVGRMLHAHRQLTAPLMSVVRCERPPHRAMRHHPDFF